MRKQHRGTLLHTPQGVVTLNKRQRASLARHARALRATGWPNGRIMGYLACLALCKKYGKPPQVQMG